MPLLSFTIYLVTFDQFYHSDYNVHCGYDREKIRKEEMALVDNGQTVHPQISANRTVWDNFYFNNFNKKGASILFTQKCNISNDLRKNHSRIHTWRLKIQWENWCFPLTISAMKIHLKCIGYNPSSHCLKITQNVVLELFDFGIFHQLLSY